MAHVYTSLIRAKMSLNGKLPPMTPISEDAQQIIDPSFTIGRGALQEDPEMGLRCPVRGCGKYFHCLGRHLTTTHGDLGGKVAVLDALDIPRITKLVSRKQLQHYRNRWMQLDADERERRRGKLTTRMRELHRLGVFRKWVGIKGLGTAGWGNHRNRCEEQMRQPLLALQTKLGRGPTMHEVAHEISEAFAWHCISLYGSWTAAMATLGIRYYTTGVSPARKKRASREHVVEQLRAYYDKHSQLPLSTQARNPSRTPLIPCMETIMRAFDTTSWAVAMEVARLELGLSPLQRKSVRYLRMERKKQTDAVKEAP